MPICYVVEMFIDRIAASKNYQKEKYTNSSALLYYENGKSFHLMHEDTRKMLELLLYMLEEKGEQETFTFIKKEVLTGHIPY